MSVVRRIPLCGRTAQLAKETAAIEGIPPPETLPICPLLPLILKGTGGFTVAMRRADKFLRSEESAALGRPLYAMDSDSQDKVVVRFERGVREFNSIVAPRVVNFGRKDSPRI